MGNFPMYDDEGTTTIQSQPNSREAEEAVLGSVLINPDSYFEISQVINPEDFTSSAISGSGDPLCACMTGRCRSIFSR